MSIISFKSLNFEFTPPARKYTLSINMELHIWSLSCFLSVLICFIALLKLRKGNYFRVCWLIIILDIALQIGRKHGN